MSPYLAGPLRGQPRCHNTQAAPFGLTPGGIPSTLELVAVKPTALLTVCLCPAHCTASRHGPAQRLHLRQAPQHGRSWGWSGVQFCAPDFRGLCCDSLTGACRKLRQHLFPSHIPPLPWRLRGQETQAEGLPALQPGPATQSFPARGPIQRGPPSSSPVNGSER